MITARPLVGDDLTAVLALLHDYDRRWFGAPLLTAEDVAAEWRTPDFDLATDSEGWEDDGRLVAFGTLGTRGAVEVAVADDWAGAGLEDALLDRWEAEARRRGFARLHRDLPADDVESRALLEARGWTLAHTGWILALPPDAVLDRRPLPDGYALRAVREQDLPAVHRVVVDAFAVYGPAQRGYDDWRAGTADRPDVDLEHWRLATHGDEVVGACLVIDPVEAPGVEPEAWVPQLAVAADHRRHGLARALLVEVALAARDRGVDRLALFTHSGTGARSLYEGVGMVVRHTLASCELAL